MNLIKNLIVGILLTKSATAMPLEAKEVGNGGNAVLCPATHSAELLDYYEARILRNMNVSMGGAKEAVAVAQFVVQRLKKISPLRALAYQKYIKSFISESRFLKGVELVEVNDSGHIFLPNNCKIVQVALQKAPMFPGDGRYVINQDVWDQMPVSSQAGLILHEVIYREALEFGSYDSRAVRYLNSILAADLLSTYTKTRFAQLMIDIGFSAYEDFGTVLKSDGSLNIILDQSKFYESVRPAQVKIRDYLFDARVPGSIIRDSAGNETSIVGAFKYRFQGKDLSLKELEFYENSGQYKYIEGLIQGDRVELSFKGANYLFYNLIRSSKYALHFNQAGTLIGVHGNFEVSNGNLKTPGMITTNSITGASVSEYGFPEPFVRNIYFSAPTKVQTRQGDLVFNGGNPDVTIELYSQGTLKEGVLEGFQKLNGVVICAEGARVSLDEKGEIDMSRLEQDPIRDCLRSK